MFIAEIIFSDTLFEEDIQKHLTILMEAGYAIQKGEEPKHYELSKED